MAPLSKTPEVPMSQQEHSKYVQTQEYSSGNVQPYMPAPFTPIYYDDEGIRKQGDIRVTTHGFQEGDFVCSGFFNMVKPDAFIHKFLSQDWHYDMRRVAQPILPFLYLGPLACSKDRDFLRREGFTLLLAIRNERSAQARLVSGEKVAAELGIIADSVDVSGNQELISMFPRAIRRINDHVSCQDQTRIPSSVPKKVLVFCESGNERSAAVVITYMMVMFSLDAGTALKLVQNRRFCVCIEDALRHLLGSFESILEAKRDVERVRRAAMMNASLAPPEIAVTRKRSFTDSRVDEETEHDMMDVDEELELDARKPMAPFQDRG